ncbi:hypothetical protein FA95DRAFT_1613662 [Auriscalpium vulgare]|uniref:Uncharacterized protein n=1 Tax=Auriscalpium vulgare TaxID=40419 RepID=A0ACB8R360_9AGAM|nr:hypothetical protein FA95DRAFT_1613662 [Auriscalpium vulgare]
MPNPRWAGDDEWNWMVQYSRDHYKLSFKKAESTAFRKKMMDAYFESFPMEPLMIDGVQEDVQLLAQRIITRKEQVKQWISNHARKNASDAPTPEPLPKFLQLTAVPTVGRAHSALDLFRADPENHHIAQTARREFIDNAEASGTEINQRELQAHVNKAVGEAFRANPEAVAKYSAQSEEEKAVAAARRKETKESVAGPSDAAEGSEEAIAARRTMLRDLDYTLQNVRADYSQKANCVILTVVGTLNEVGSLQLMWGASDPSGEDGFGIADEIERSDKSFNAAMRECLTRIFPSLQDTTAIAQPVDLSEQTPVDTAPALPQTPKRTSSSATPATGSRRFVRASTTPQRPPQPISTEPMLLSPIFEAPSTIHNDALSAVVPAAVAPPDIPKGISPSARLLSPDEDELPHDGATRTPNATQDDAVGDGVAALDGVVTQDDPLPREAAVAQDAAVEPIPTSKSKGACKRKITAEVPAEPRRSSRRQAQVVEEPAPVASAPFEEPTSALRRSNRGKEAGKDEGNVGTEPPAKRRKTTKRK